ncbi:hypothetical protein C6P45_004020 [Maudiozyma exigua]|uniref:Uncharacterized protein n=1 Tax=Maudiozyma exigua TaxID=34358 RepID=A0A9P6WBB4_MAUEX|nr:hypothetical protein C6P45_004020 [Kazachstania exigua]
MQGGIRRKKDLLPRYKKKGNYDNRTKNGFFSKYSRQLKIILAYLGLLLLVYLILNIAFSDMNKPPSFELDNSNIKQNNNNNNNQIKNEENNIPDSNIKKQFHNEVARQKEVENLIPKKKINKNLVQDANLI